MKKEKKKLKLKKEVKEILIVILIMTIIIIGSVIALNYRMDALCNNGYTQYCPSK